MNGLDYVADVPVAELRTYHRNPRQGDVKAIAQSLTVHGQYRALAVNRGTHTGRPNEVLAGNHTLLAARDLGWESVAVTYVDVDDDQAARIVLVDNKSADVASYDETLLAELLAELPDLEGTGYSTADLDEIAKLIYEQVPETGSIAGDAGIDDLGATLFTVVVECAGEREQQDALEQCLAQGLRATAVTK